MDLNWLLAVFINIVIIALVCGLLWWLVGFAAARGVLQPPFTGVLQVLVAAVAVVMLISVLLGGVSLHSFRLR